MTVIKTLLITEKITGPTEMLKAGLMQIVLQVQQSSANSLIFYGERNKRFIRIRNHRLAKPR
jgi:hypothetical protein